MFHHVVFTLNPTCFISHPTCYGSAAKLLLLKTSFLITSVSLPLHAKELFHETSGPVIWLAAGGVGRRLHLRHAGAQPRQTSNATVWLVVAAVACHSIAYRFYSRFIADKVFERWMTAV